MSADRVRSEDLESGAARPDAAATQNGALPEEGAGGVAPREAEDEPAEDASPEEGREAPEEAAAEAPSEAEPSAEPEPAEEAPRKPKRERRWLRGKGDKDKGKDKGKEKDEAKDKAAPEETDEDQPAAEGSEAKPEAPAETGEEGEAELEEGVKRSRLRWKKKEMPAGLFIKCEACSATIYRKELVGKGMVCPDCGFHFTLGGRERIEMVLDEGTWEEHFAEIETLDRLEFTDKISYGEKIARTVERLGQKEALLLGTGAIEGRPLVLSVLDFKFMGGSMGEVVGEKIALGVEMALARRLPMVVFTSSGGARMHEGMLSLMQMAKTCAALQTMREEHGLSVCVMTNPTTGGVTASFASVCDIVLAEPGALIGFAGPRVIATTLKQELPKGFQRAEFLLEKGQIDAIVPRAELRGTLARLIDFGEGAWR